MFAFCAIMLQCSCVILVGGCERPRGSVGWSNGCFNSLSHCGWLSFGSLCSMTQGIQVLLLGGRDWPTRLRRGGLMTLIGILFRGIVFWASLMTLPVRSALMGLWCSTLMHSWTGCMI